MKARKLIASATGGVAIVMATLSIAWACGVSVVTDMTLKNKDNTSWDAGSKDKNYSECPAARQAGLTGNCSRPVVVTGTNFVNDSEVKAVQGVTLYWMDEPQFAPLAGTGHRHQQTVAGWCQMMGVQLTPTPISVAADGSFTAEVVVPPMDDKYHNFGAKDIDRPVKTYPGANAVCAVWDHDTLPVGPSAGDHQAGIANQYNIWP